MTPLEIATDLCKPYAIRGDDYDSYRLSYHGAASGKYWASVMGHEIVITKIENKDVNYKVKLKDAWSNALAEQLRLI